MNRTINRRGTAATLLAAVFWVATSHAQSAPETGHSQATKAAPGPKGKATPAELRAARRGSPAAAHGAEPAAHGAEPAAPRPRGPTGSNAREGHPDTAPMKQPRQALPRAGRGTRQAGHTAKERAASRRAQRLTRIQQLKSRWGEHALRKRDVQRAVKVHAWRAARLHRIAAIAEQQGDEELSERAKSLLERESERFEEQMTGLQGPSEPVGEAPPEEVASGQPVQAPAQSAATQPAQPAKTPGGTP